MAANFARAAICAGEGVLAFTLGEELAGFFGFGLRFSGLGCAGFCFFGISLGFGFLLLAEIGFCIFFGAGFLEDFMGGIDFGLSAFAA